MNRDLVSSELISSPVQATAENLQLALGQRPVWEKEQLLHDTWHAKYLRG